MFFLPRFCPGIPNYRCFFLPNDRKLQEDLTDEMVVLARQLKESSLLVNRSVQNTEKVETMINLIFNFWTFSLMKL